MNGQEFEKKIWQYYRKHRREFSWRHPYLKTNPKITSYHIVVSEIMLQQTQASRVVKKFEPFIEKFPDWQTLAAAPTGEVLKAWQGLGYNRRALNLQRLARIVEERGGELPRTREELAALPGIGPNTAGSTLAFAWNIPSPFIETNIRAAFIHFFFSQHRGKVHDKKLLPLIEKTLAHSRNKKNPRDWYYALMDYGCYLKQAGKNPSRKSKHHVKQSKFKGSNRELRAQILRFILQKPATLVEVSMAFPDKATAVVTKNIIDLEKEGFLKRTETTYSVA